eukprot:COSAG02_NODE_2194_length_9554_cov_12.883659_7_plen_111_part_00
MTVSSSLLAHEDRSRVPGVLDGAVDVDSAVAYLGRLSPIKAPATPAAASAAAVRLRRSLVSVTTRSVTQPRVAAFGRAASQVEDEKNRRSSAACRCSRRHAAAVIPAVAA